MSTNFWKKKSYDSFLWLSSYCFTNEKTASALGKEKNNFSFLETCLFPKIFSSLPFLEQKWIFILSFKEEQRTTKENCNINPWMTVKLVDLLELHTVKILLLCFFCCFVRVLALWYSILFLKIPTLTQFLHFYSAPSSGLLIFAMNAATIVF